MAGRTRATGRGSGSSVPPPPSAAAPGLQVSPAPIADTLATEVPDEIRISFTNLADDPFAFLNNVAASYTQVIERVSTQFQGMVAENAREKARRGRGMGRRGNGEEE